MLSVFVFHLYWIVDDNVPEILVLTQRVETEPDMRTVNGLDYPGGALLVPASDFPLGALHLSLVFQVLNYIHGGSAECPRKIPSKGPGHPYRGRRKLRPRVIA
ncbi:MULTISPECIES: hypothetical protein [Nocardia]|uniref:hypothetical protein n=1 Tax=Nocardia TaxID=1817 RepID=UPI0012D74189|nr:MULTISPECIES: hypothetical protein [Nocardia]MBF6278329.1 hypothetical protein [Nocardia nova]